MEESHQNINTENVSQQNSFVNNNKEIIIENYIKSIRKIKQQTSNGNCKNNLTGKDFDEFLLEKYILKTKIAKNDRDLSNSITPRQTTTTTTTKAMFIKSWKIYRKTIVYLFVAIFVPFAIVNYRSIAISLFMKNIQNFIYPGMSLWRKLTIPLIKTFPGLTEFYDESCLVANPLFQIKDLDCHPCMNVVTVLDISDLIQSQSSAASSSISDDNPYIFNTYSTAITLEQLYDLYSKNLTTFKQDAFKVQSTNKNIKTLNDLFLNFLNTNTTSQKSQKQDESHNLWRCNRMNPLRLLRKLIILPKNQLPQTGIGIERYLTIDTANAPAYQIPDMDCSKVFVYQIKGSRTFILKPTNECQEQCRTISIRLPESYILIYNWWYWKPISVADHYQKSTSISYIGAYC